MSRRGHTLYSTPSTKQGTLNWVGIIVVVLRFLNAIEAVFYYHRAKTQFQYSKTAGFVQGAVDIQRLRYHCGVLYTK